METYVAPWPVWLFAGIMVAVILWWFRLVANFFSYMSKNHLGQYQEMGSPTLFMNNTPKNNISFLRYILGNKYQELNDEALNKMCGFMKVFFYTYSVAFMLLLIGFFSVGNS